MTPRKPNQPTLTKNQIIEAAMAIVDLDGLGRLSMRRLARHLGMSPMSLYYHIPDKSALYDSILDVVMSEVDLSGDDRGKPVEERLIVVGHALRDALLAHPNAVTLALSRSLHTEAQLRPVEAILAMLSDAGLSPSDAMGIVNIMGQYILGTAAAYANHVVENELHRSVQEEDFAALATESFPHTTRAVSEADYVGFEEDFDRGLRALVRGLLS